MTTQESEINSKERPAGDGQVRAEPSPRWIRVLFDGDFVADSKRALLVHSQGRPPVYYFPADDVRTDQLEKSDKVAHFPGLGEAQYWTFRSADRTAENVAFSHPNPPDERPELRDHFAFKWDEMDAWFEEDQQVFVHARDPYTRVDVLPSSRHVRVEVEGVRVAESLRPYLLFETGLPTRYYLPRLDVRMDLLEPSDTHTVCPYKGTASYYSLRIGDRLYRDLIWTYPDPVPECPKIANLLAFFNEKVDLIVDGELQARPKTVWS